MADPKQKDRGAPAAQPDLLGDEARNTGSMEGLDENVGADGTPRDRGQAEGEARPGRDENQAGFVRDRDKRSQP
jgi:hypothetical protein